MDNNTPIHELFDQAYAHMKGENLHSYIGMLEGMLTILSFGDKGTDEYIRKSLREIYTKKENEYV